MRGNLTEDKKKTKAGELIVKTNKSAKVITDEISNVVLGKEQTIEILMAGILANGNILFEDYPGLAKTLMRVPCTCHYLIPEDGRVVSNFIVRLLFHLSVDG